MLESDNDMDFEGENLLKNPVKTLKVRSGPRYFSCCLNQSSLCDACLFFLSLVLQSSFYYYLYSKEDALASEPKSK